MNLYQFQPNEKFELLGFQMSLKFYVTFKPGCIRMPRWRKRILLWVTYSPSVAFKPLRLPIACPFRFLLLPPAFLEAHRTQLTSVLTKTFLKTKKETNEETSRVSTTRRRVNQLEALWVSHNTFHYGISFLFSFPKFLR